MQTHARATEDEIRSHGGNRTATNEAAICDLIQRYKICWEVWPEWLVNNSQLEKTGFDLELLGTHAEGTDHVSPGCDSCVEVYDALRKVARYIVPDDQRLPTLFEIEPFEPALRYASIRKNRPDVLLEIKITHRNGLGPLDDCERHCLQLMQNRLHALGAYRGQWAPDPDCPSQQYKGEIRPWKTPATRCPCCEGTGFPLQAHGSPLLKERKKRRMPWQP